MIFTSPNEFGRSFRVLGFGESHGGAVGVVLDGVKAGLPFDVQAIQAELDRRRPGQSALSTSRQEPDRLHVLSGVFENKTTGHPVALVVYNQDARPEDYETLRDLFRPGHADYTHERKYGLRDHRGGGRASARETVARVIAGAWAKQRLAPLGIRIRGFNREIAGIAGESLDWSFVESNPLRVADPDRFDAQRAAVENAREMGDSVGGITEVWIEGLPVGLGDPVFAGLDALLTFACMSIAGVKGVEIGAGFKAARMKGSDHNDPFGPAGPLKNDAGGLLGGISTGAPVVLRLAVKPASSIARVQETVDRAMRPANLHVKGRHDSCIAPRIVPVAEAMCAVAIYDAWLVQQDLKPGTMENIEEYAWDFVETILAQHNLMG